MPCAEGEHKGGVHLVGKLPSPFLWQFVPPVHPLSPAQGSGDFGLSSHQVQGIEARQPHPFAQAGGCEVTASDASIWPSCKVSQDFPAAPHP